MGRRHIIYRLYSSCHSCLISDHSPFQIFQWLWTLPWPSLDHRPHPPHPPHPLRLFSASRRSPISGATRPPRKVRHGIGQLPPALANHTFSHHDIDDYRWLSESGLPPWFRGLWMFLWCDSFSFTYRFFLTDVCFELPYCLLCFFAFAALPTSPPPLHIYNNSLV